MTSLFHLAGDALRLDRLIDEAAQDLVGDDPDKAARATALLEGLISAEGETRHAIDAKADAWCWAIDRLRVQGAARRAHAARLDDLARADEHAANALQEKLVRQLLILDPAAIGFNLPSHQLKSRRATAVELDVEAMDLPEQFQRAKTSISADRDAIRSAIKAGEIVAGARLVERRSWSVG